MASFSVIENFTVNRKEDFLAKADASKHPLLHKQRFPKETADIRWQDGVIHVKPEFPYEELASHSYGRSDRVRLDFGEHMVGYLTMKIDTTGSHPDAPAFLHLKFGQNPMDLLAKSRDYRGWLSKSWIQEEYIHIDTFPAVVTLPRRYAFRYLSIRVLDTSQKYKVTFSEISVDAVSAVSRSSVPEVDHGDPMLNAIDRVGVKTLQDCMQDVFEDGPKRDQRLWLGDLRLQALANYATFQDYDMVRRCLYLFAGLTFNEGRISACLFTEPDYEPDDTYLLDYALIFVPALLDYYEASGDKEALLDLYEIAQKQIDLAIADLDEEGLVKDLGDAFWCFLDWGDELNKHAGANAVLLYAMKYGIRMAEAVGDSARAEKLREEREKLSKVVFAAFWDAEKQLFVSGPDRQISWASQIWMVHAEVLSEEEGRNLLLRTEAYHPEVKMQTPYIYHYYVTALLKCGMEEKAIEVIKRYWGGMVEAGADTFWEVYDPEDVTYSPYGSAMLNSYCHAWSCTPTFILRKYR